MSIGIFVWRSKFHWSKQDIQLNMWNSAFIKMNALAGCKQLAEGKIWKTLPRVLQFHLIINSAHLKLVRIFFSSCYLPFLFKVLILFFSLLSWGKTNLSHCIKFAAFKDRHRRKYQYFKAALLKNIHSFQEKSLLKSQLIMCIYFAKVAMQVCFLYNHHQPTKNPDAPNTFTFFILTQEDRQLFWWTRTKNKWNSLLTFINSRLDMLQHSASLSTLQHPCLKSAAPETLKLFPKPVS